MPRPPIRASDEAWIEKRKSCWINTRIPVVGCLRYSLTSASALAVLHVIQKRIMVPLTFDHLTGWKNILSRLTLEYGLLEMKQNKIFLRNIQVLHITSECHFKVRYHQKTLPHFDVFQWALCGPVCGKVHWYWYSWLLFIHEIPRWQRDKSEVAH